MAGSSFQTWADRNNLTPAERRAVLQEVRDRNPDADVDRLPTTEFEEAARTLGLFISMAKRLFRFFRSWF